MYPSVLWVGDRDWEAMRDHVQACFPREACGLLGGKEGRVKVVCPVTNVAEDETRFRMAPREQVEAMLGIEALGYELIGIYHSHPRGPSAPSMRDIDALAYPRVAMLIWSPTEGGWTCRAFILLSENPVEIPLHISPGPTP